MTFAAVWIGGEPPIQAALVDLPAFDLVVAADSGLDAAIDAGHRVDVLVGDLDSARPDLVDAFVASGGEVVRFPADKDFTDLELALDVIVERCVDEGVAASIVVLGGGGGRLDHELGSLLVLTLEKYADIAIEARIGTADVRVARGSVKLTGTAGEVVSLLPLADEVGGVTTTGLRWPLVDATLTRGATWSLSNEFVGDTAEVAVGRGVLLVVRPSAFG